MKRVRYSIANAELQSVTGAWVSDVQRANVEKGPREARVEWLWDQTWKAFEEGRHFQFFAAQAAAELAKFGATLPPNDHVAANDLDVAERLDRSHRETFAARLASQEKMIEGVVEQRKLVQAEVGKVNFFAFQSLALANGAVALGTLAYLGKGGAVPRGLVVVLALSALGFLLTLLSAHVAVIRSVKFIQLLTELSQSTISEAVRIAKFQELPKVTRRAAIPSRILSYMAAGCLVAAAIIGTLSLS